MIEYRLTDVDTQREYIQTLHPDYIARMRDDIKFQMERLLTALDETLANQEEHSCNVCEAIDYGYKGIPSDWAYMVETNALLCDKCIGDWFQRFDLPELSKEIRL